MVVNLHFIYFKKTKTFFSAKKHDWRWFDFCCGDLQEHAEKLGGVLFFHTDLHALAQRTQGFIVGATRPCSLCSVWPIKHYSGRGTLPLIVYWPGWKLKHTHTHTCTITFTFISGLIWASTKPAAAIYMWKDQLFFPPTIFIWWI